MTKRGSPFTVVAAVLIAMMALTGCASAQYQLQDDQLRQNVERADIFLEGVSVEVPKLAPYIAPVRVELQAAAEDGVIDETDLRPALRLLKKEFDAYIVSDADIGDERRDRLLKWAGLIERFVRTFLPPEDSDTKSAPTAYLRRLEVSPAVMPGAG